MSALGWPLHDLARFSENCQNLRKKCPCRRIGRWQHTRFSPTSTNGATMDNPLNLKEFGKELTRIQRPLYLYIVSLVGNAVEASDLLQETNCLIWEKAEEFQPGSNLTAWAYSIARFKVLEWRRGQDRRRVLPGEAVLEMLAERAAARDDGAAERLAALEHCLGRLGEADRGLILARYEGADLEQLAAARGRTANALYQSLFRIRRLLRDCVQRQIADGDES